MRLFFLVVFCLLVACTPGSTSVPRANTITCQTAYRSATGVPIEREETLTFKDSDGVESITFAELIFHAQYSSGQMNNERALRLWVTESGQDDELLSQLYQLPADAGPQNQFIGGHGFTGLNYAYHPRSGAELQFWCSAS